MRLPGVEQPARKEARSATNPRQSLRYIDSNILANIGGTLTRHKQNEVGGQAKPSIEKEAPGNNISAHHSNLCVILSQVRRNSRTAELENRNEAT